MANHNLNVAVQLASITGADGESLLLPNTAQLNITNGQYEEPGQLGEMVLNCNCESDQPTTNLPTRIYSRT
jgi:hypothetical protein